VTEVCRLPGRDELPHAADAEESLLGGILLDSHEFANVLPIVCAADFYDLRNATAFAAMVELARNGQPIDRVMVKDELSRAGHLEDAGGDDRIDLLDKVVPAAANVRYYALIVADRALIRRTILAATGIAKLGAVWHGTAEEFAAEAMRRMAEARQSVRKEVSRAA
jgi:replicative DNA helicase